ncbi:MAG: hypothetical protein H6Q30_2089 [Bacteroidetes bacterium]|nr:hypothetical protein [Bacteroidota bacterium]
MKHHYLFKCMAPHDQNINRIQECFESVVLAGPAPFEASEPIDITVFSGDEAVEAGRNED